MEVIIGILKDAWAVIVEAAPFLILGLFVAGLLRVFLSAALVTRYLGQGRVRSVVMASVLGVPLISSAYTNRNSSRSSYSGDQGAASAVGVPDRCSQRA